MSTSFAARLRIAVLAVVVAGWLAVSLRTSELTADGIALVNSPRDELTPAKARGGIETVRDAQLLNADAEAVVNEVILLTASGQIGQSKALAERLVRDEPENADAWFVLWVASRAARENARAEQAIATLRSLDPLRGNVLQRFGGQPGS